MASHKVVLCHGCFDPFHPGHLLHLEAARKFGKRLVVAVTRDEFVFKGPNRPVFGEKLRARVLKGLRCVDQVILARDSLEALQKVKPDVFVKGKEYQDAIEPEHEAYCRSHGIRIEFTDEQVFSSTKLLPHYDRPDAS